MQEFKPGDIVRIKPRSPAKAKGHIGRVIAGTVNQGPERPILYRIILDDGYERRFTTGGNSTPLREHREFKYIDLCEPEWLTRCPQEDLESRAPTSKPCYVCNRYCSSCLENFGITLPKEKPKKGAPAVPLRFGAIEYDVDGKVICKECAHYITLDPYTKEPVFPNAAVDEKVFAQFAAYKKRVEATTGRAFIND